MGGKNAAAVLADADLELAVTEVMAGAFRSTGQKCTATSRLIVTERVADDFLDRLVRRTESLVVGDPLHPETQLGPVISARARADIQGAVDDGLTRDNVRLLAGGRRYADPERTTGTYVAPTVVEIAGSSDRNGGGPNDALWRDEVFGPVLTVRRAGERQRGP